MALGRRAVGVAIQKHRGIRLWRCVTGVVTWKYLPQKFWTSGPLLARCGRVDVEASSSGDQLRSCRHLPQELWNSEGARQV